MLPVCNGGSYWSDLLKNIAMLRNKHKKNQRMLFTDTTERKKGWSGFSVPCSSTHRMRGRAHSVFLSLLLPHATQEVTQCSPPPSATGAWVSELLPSPGLLPTTCFCNPCFHIESNLDLHTEKSHKLPKQKQMPSQQDGSFHFCKLYLEVLKKKSCLGLTCK